MQINSSKAGKLIKLQTGCQAFLPNSLPPSIEWDDQLVWALSQAEHVLGKLSREGAMLPNPRLLIRPFVVKEAVLSSKIEGTYATIGDVLAYSAGAKIKHDPDDLEEVVNYITALEYGLDRLKELPFCLRLIKEIHGVLMQGVRGGHATPGEFRRSQNWIGPPGATLNNAVYVPPPIDYLLDCLGDFEKFLHNRQLPALIHAAICHYQFEAIHPFLDGNGRIGRLLIILLLIEQNKIPSPLLYLSAFFEATRNEYYRQLLNVTTEGGWNDWLIYFLSGVAVQAEDALSRAERINRLLGQWKLQMVNSRSSVAVNIVEHFAMNPYLTTKKIADELGVSFNTAQLGIDQLVKKGIVKKVMGNARFKVYCALDILQILEEPAKIYAMQ